jgi:hypothetical protein
LLWEQVPVTLPHFVGLVAHPFVDHSLINAAGGEVRCK